MGKVLVMKAEEKVKEEKVLHISFRIGTGKK